MTSSHRRPSPAQVLGSCCSFHPDPDNVDVSPRTRRIVRSVLAALAIVLIVVIIRAALT
ncbi:MAG TPA: hypothetical protein VHD87_16410 [Acidimicrobiales bacterium]|nr:hypothetical protein [Acidimicrobiales bacterium]